MLVLPQRHPTRKININGTEIVSKKSMNVFGVHFDTKLNWQTHLQIAITKSQKALQTIRIIRKHFTKKELLTLIISNYYSILYFEAIIWALLDMLIAISTCIVLIQFNFKWHHLVYWKSNWLIEFKLNYTDNV